MVIGGLLGFWTLRRSYLVHRMSEPPQTGSATGTRYDLIGHTSAFS